MKHELRKLLSGIITEKMEIKSRLNMLSFLLKEKRNIHASEVDKLLDRIDYLDKLEKEIRKMIL
jgi:hypothetical protein